MPPPNQPGPIPPPPQLPKPTQIAITVGDWERGIVQILGWLLVLALTSSAFYLALRICLWLLERVHEGLGL